MSTSEPIRHEVQLRLNGVGFRGEEVERMLPSFMTERDTLVGLTWYPTAEGPNKYFLLITIYLAVRLVAKSFLEELGKDIYKWMKESVAPILKDKRVPVGEVTIKFDDVTFGYFEETPDPTIDPDEIPIVALWLHLPNLVSQADPDVSMSWGIRFDAKTRTWHVTWDGE